MLFQIGRTGPCAFWFFFRGFECQTGRVCALFFLLDLLCFDPLVLFCVVLPLLLLRFYAAPFYGRHDLAMAIVPNFMCLMKGFSKVLRVSFVYKKCAGSYRGDTVVLVRLLHGRRGRGLDGVAPGLFPVVEGCRRKMPLFFIFKLRQVFVGILQDLSSFVYSFQLSF